MQLLGAAERLDPVLAEFGLQPHAPLGSGPDRFGLRPRDLSELDPHHRLVRIWRRYRGLYAELERLPEADGAPDVRGALSRWRGLRERG